jgi:hypothetical protein
MKIFVSHDSQDAPLALALKSFLEGIFLNASVFVSGRDLAGGEVWIESLRQTLADATAIIAIVTPRARTNRWVLFEAGAGFPNRRTIPLVVGLSFSELGPPLSLLQARAMDEDGLKALVSDLARLAGLRLPVRFPGVEVVLEELATFSKRKEKTVLKAGASSPVGFADAASKTFRSTNVSADPQLSEAIETLKARAKDVLTRGLARQRASFDVPSDSELASLRLHDLVQLSQIVGLTFPFGLSTDLLLLHMEDALPTDAPSWKKTKQQKDLEAFSQKLDDLEKALAT